MALTKITATNIGANAAANSIGYVPANKAGDTFTGQLMIENQAESGYANNLAESVTKAVVKMKPHNGDSTLTTFGSLANGVAGSASVGNGYIQRSNGPGTGTYHMYLNPFGGAVAMPNQPVFRVRMGATLTSSTYPIPFNTAVINRGSCFNTSSYRFTAPIAGAYLFHLAQHYLSLSSADIGCDIKKNGTGVYSTDPYTVSVSRLHVDSTVIIDLAVNDYVDVGFTRYAGSGNLEGQSATFNTFFEGHLIG